MMPIKYQRTVKTSNQLSQSPLNKQLINFLVRWEYVNLPVKSNISVVFLTDIIFFYYIRLKVSFLLFLFRSWVFKYLWKVFLLYYYVETTIWKISCGSWRDVIFDFTWFQVPRLLASLSQLSEAYSHCPKNEVFH